jgi:hypothetical protein
MIAESAGLPHGRSGSGPMLFLPSLKKAVDKQPELAIFKYTRSLPLSSQGRKKAQAPLDLHKSRGPSGKER